MRRGNHLIAAQAASLDWTPFVIENRSDKRCGKPHTEMTENKSPKKISAKAIMTDLKAEMSDSELMSKYGISFQGLQDLFEKLVQAGLATQSYFAKRSARQTSQRSSEQSRTCPYCGFKSHEPFRECPRCHQDVSEWLDTVELTKILTGSFGE